MLTSDYTRVPRRTGGGKLGSIFLPEEDENIPGVEPCPDQNETGNASTGAALTEWDPIPFVKDCQKWRYKMYPFGVLPLAETHPISSLPQLAPRTGQDYYGCLHAATHGVELRASPSGGKWNDTSFVFAVPFYYHPDMNDGYLWIDVGYASVAGGSTGPDRLGYDKVSDTYGTAAGIYRRAIARYFLNNIRIHRENGTEFRTVTNDYNTGQTVISRAGIPRSWFDRGEDVYKFWISVNRTNPLNTQDTMQHYMTYFRTMMKEEASFYAYKPSVTTLSNTILPREQIADYRMGGQQPIENNSCDFCWVKNSGAQASYTAWPQNWDYGTDAFDHCVGFQGDGQIVPFTDQFMPSTPNVSINDSWMYHVTFANSPDTVLVGHTNNGSLQHTVTHFYFLRDIRNQIDSNMTDMENVSCTAHLKEKAWRGDNGVTPEIFPY